MSQPLRWGIIGCGRIAGALAGGLSHTSTGDLYAVASRSQEKADAFAKEHNATKAYGSYEALLADSDVDAVYVATPHPQHMQWAIAAANAGKHILCEKPIGLNEYDAQAIIEAARKNNVFLMEAFMYRCHPQTRKVVELIKEGAIGEVRFISAAFGFDASKADEDSRILSNALGGGGILDVGCYPVSMSRLVAGAAMGKPFADPVEVSGGGYLGKTNIDNWAAGVLTFENGIVAQVSTAVCAAVGQHVTIIGSEGKIQIDLPWIISKEGGTATFLLNDEPVEVEETRWLYQIEADTVAAAVNAGKTQADSPAMSWDDTLGNMRTLDRWRNTFNLVYEAETAEGYSKPVHGGALTKPAESQVAYSRVDGVDLDISRLVMGCDNQSSVAHAFTMFDAFYEVGGTCFDTAHIYGHGTPQKLLGQWIKSRGVRDKVAIIDKGAHSPFCDPENLSKQVEIDLDRLQTDYADLYFMHRDNVDIPVGEFVDVLHEHVSAGRLKAVGGSNWTLERVQAFNEYAKANGKTPFAATSNNFSLAQMIKPVWGGCIASSEPTYRQWHIDSQTANFAWSSQARGFFVPERDLEEPELKRCWVSDDNLKRRARAIELAEKRGVLPVNIALAYVLCQPFPMFALFGPRQLSEMYSSLPGATMQLSPEELAWLNLETDILS